MGKQTNKERRAAKRRQERDSPSRSAPAPKTTATKTKRLEFTLINGKVKASLEYKVSVARKRVPIIEAMREQYRGSFAPNNYIVEFLLDTVTSWSPVERREPIPLTAEGLNSMSLRNISDVFNAIADDV